MAEYPILIRIRLRPRIKASQNIISQHFSIDYIKIINIFK